MDRHIKIEKNNYLSIYLKVKPNSHISAIGKFEEIYDKICLKVSINAPPIDGKANDSLIGFLSKTLKISKKNLELTKGTSSSLKRLLIKNIPLASLKSILMPYIDISNKN